MNIKEILWKAAQDGTGALPILSFPATGRIGATVEELVKDSEIQARAMVFLANETDTLAAVSPMDLSVEAEAFGARVRFFNDDVPAVYGALVTDEDEAKAITIPDLRKGRIQTSLEGIRLAKERIQNKPVLAGMIGPFSLAGRLMDVTEIMYTCVDDPETVSIVLEKTTQFLISYAKAFREAGADGIVMAEPLAGILSPDMAKCFSHGYVKKIVDEIQKDDFSILYHNCGNATPHMLDDIFEIGAEAYHFGNAVDMVEILRNAPKSVICMGNIDPVGQFVQGTPESMSKAVIKLKALCKSYKNFILSSGCDIPTTAKWENIDAFFSAAKEK